MSLSIYTTVKQATENARNNNMQQKLCASKSECDKQKILSFPSSCDYIFSVPIEDCMPTKIIVNCSLLFIETISNS